MELLLVRHGETDWNCDGRIQGWIDVGLNDDGRRQLEGLSPELPDEPVDLFYSPLRRARESAEQVRRHLTCRSRRPVPQFRELDQGYWDGLRGEWLAQQEDERYRRWIDSPLTTSPPGGESLQTVRERVRDGLVEVLEETPGPAVVVVHKVVINLIRHLAGECPFPKVLEALPANAEVISVSVNLDDVTGEPPANR